MFCRSHRPRHCLLIALVTVGLAGSASAQDTGNNFAISNFNPSSGPVGTVVTLNGSGLSLATGVTINGKAATFKVTQPYQVQATVPAGATSGPIVATRTGATATSATSFIVTTGGGGSAPPANTVVAPAPHVNPPAAALTSHPRLWIRPTDLNRLRGWAVPGNTIWSDLSSVAATMKVHMLQGKVPQLDSGDGEGNGYQYPTEEYAEMFALMSLIDPIAANRTDWAQRAHDLMMFMMNNAVQGPAANQPFRSIHFAIFNRSRWFGEAFPLVVDWCYSTFTAAEKVTIRKVFIRWCQENLDVNVAGGSYVPQPTNMFNNAALVNGPGKTRWSANNYWCNHARNIGMMALALDPADDVPTGPSDPCYSGYLRDYIGNVMGSHLYIRKYAESHDLAGGLSPEGTSYSESSLSGISMLLLALHTAGYDDPIVYGVGAGLATGNYWQTEVMDAYIHSMSPQTASFASWMPPMFLPAGYGDVLRYETNDMIRQFGPLAIMDIMDGTNPSRLNKIRWMQTVLSPGGAANLHSRLITSINNYGTMLPILYFMVFDPTAQPAADPRASLATEMVAPGLNRILSRTDWTANATWFAFISTWNSIDHQWGDSNSFSFYRKGEWLTKEWSGYGKNIGSPDYQNNLSIENPPLNPNTPGFNVDEGKHGGQYSYSSNGDPVVTTSVQSAYAFADADATNRYNGNGILATDVAHASRSILYVKPDVTVVYDRAVSKSPNKYKRFYLNFATPPSITGNVARVTTAKGQRLWITSLLPIGATLNWDAPTTVFAWDENATDEPMHYRLIVQDLAKPQSIRFLHVLQGADGTATPLAVSLIQSSAGSAYQGASFGDTAAMFPVNLGQLFQGVSYTAPTTVSKHYVSGLNPGSGYTVMQQSTVAGTIVTITSGGSLMPDPAGVLKF